jgi:hypothetical protein
MKFNYSPESSMTKVHMRNLRAKVMQLLSPDRCKCSVYREDRVNQLELKKRVWKGRQSKK